MIKKNYLCSAFLLAGMMASQSTSALVIGEIEPNNTLATSQSVETSFSTGTVTDIFNSDIGWEWTSVLATGDGSYDYFSFDAVAGQTFIFDIDYGMNNGGAGHVDTEIGLWSIAGGSSLFQQDDGCLINGSQCVLDSGSIHSWDPTRSWTFASSGTYIIGVGEYNSYDNDGIGGFDPGSNVLDAGDTYTLQISRDTVSAPEPGVLALMCLGLIGIRFSRKKKAV